MKSIFQTLKILTLALALSFGLSYELAWTPPSAPPPGGNIAAPVNTGSATSLQSILGKLIIGMPTNSSMLTLDVRATSSAATNAPLRNIFQVASRDTTNPLALRFGIKTDAIATNRYGSIEVKDGATNQDLALQPNGGNVGIGTITPTKKLDIVGELRTTGTTTVGRLNAASAVITGDITAGGQSVCREDGTNCPAGVGVPTLAQVTAMGATATATLQLLGGFIAASSTAGQGRQGS